jgi:uncharacterized protein YjgD (DUF1641 family)
VASVSVMPATQQPDPARALADPVIIEVTGLLRALKDPDVGRALDSVLSIGKAPGKELDKA